MNDFDELKTAARIHIGGDLSTAEALYTKIIEEDPLDSEALHLMGVLLHQKGENQKAARFILRAITIKSTNANYYNNLGSIYRSDCKIEKAKNCYRKALMLNPEFPEALFNLAGIYHFLKDYELALRYYRNAVAAKPSFPEALNNMAATLNIQKKYTEAIPLCEQAIKLRPDYNEAFNNMANSYKNLGKLTQAIELYKKAMQLSGENAEIICNLANAYQETGALEKATAAYEKAIRLNPSYSKAYTYLGTILRSKRKMKEAEFLFKKSIQMDPKDDETYHNMGNLYYDQGDFHSAAHWYDRAISINPTSVQTYINLGITYQETDQSDAAISCFEKVLELDPDNSKVHSHIIHELYQRCEWSRVDALNLRIDQFTDAELNAGRRPNEMPFLSLIRRDDPFINYQVAKHWSSPIAENLSHYEKQMRVKPQRKAGNKITVGYLSNNFRNHPTAHLINDIFQLHDKDRFTINVYSYGEDDGSLYRRKIEQNCDVFVDLRDRAHGDAARQIFNDHVDILVDLVGYMRGHRLEISACHPAPIQVRWLGLAGTTGADFFDYLITDRIATPEDHAPFYSEKFIYMPDTYQVNSKLFAQSETKLTRNDVGLPENAFVYCCFCSNYKIDPTIFSVWMDILKSVPDSVLWLFKSKPVVEQNLRKEAERCGVKRERLVFAERMPKEDHLVRIGLADFALDTRMVNGAATTSDALYAGVPVLTLLGGHFASKMSASILNAIGLSDLVVTTKTAYERKAIEFGKNPLTVWDIRERLRNNRKKKALFDTQRFVNNLEKAFLKIWRQYQDGKTPRIITIE